MGRFKEYTRKMAADLKSTFLRFATLPIFLAFITILVSLQIEKTFPKQQLTIQRLIISAIAGAFLAVAIEFTCERFRRLVPYRIYLQCLSIAASVLYYIFLAPPEKNGTVVMIRLFVICFALFAFYLWIPSFKSKGVFPENALANFKACFTSMLYSLVLMLGSLAIYFAIDLLLVKLDNDIPLHILNIAGMFFFPLYYLALLPDFNSKEDRMTEKCNTAASYPRFLEILVSYIAIPLIMLFTGVLAVYLIKILIALKWPVGELGPMILGYSAIGLFLFVICSKLGNRFATTYRRYFPFVLIPLVCLQMYSVLVRVNAYGITETRYYLVLFGVYSIACAVVTSSQRA
jgi:hypothetical protein